MAPHTAGGTRIIDFHRARKDAYTIACNLSFCITYIGVARARRVFARVCACVCVRRRLRRATHSLVLAPSHSLQSHVRHRHLSLCAAYTCWQRTRIQVMPLSQRDGS
jgi:hypothetical protein